MGGRADFEEQRESKKDLYKRLAKRAEERSQQYLNSNANRILQMTPGQPILIGHHSEMKARRLHEKAWSDIGKSIEEDKKQKYYQNKAKDMDNTNVIYNDDPNAIEKLKAKVEYLEKQKELIKADENHSTWQLQNIGARIRETKKRISRLEKLENVEFNDIEFNGGKIIRNKDINRIQILFNDIPSENIRNELKHKGFHWSRREGAWQREFNEQTIKVTTALVKDVFSKENVVEQEEEDEFE